MNKKLLFSIIPIMLLLAVTSVGAESCPEGMVKTHLETLTVQATGEVATSSVLDSGTEYLLKASGTAFAGDTIDFDAKYSITNRISGDTWTDTVSGYTSYGTDLLELKVDDEFVDWGAYDAGHIYWQNITGGGVSIPFQIYDIYYPNNTGSLTVDIYECVVERSAKITSPKEDEEVSGLVSFDAILYDDDEDDNVQWAVRKGTCAAGTNTVFGNVDGFNDDYTWTNNVFNAVADTSGWELGEYCFIFNPTEGSGEENIRLTREFVLVEQIVGQTKAGILKESGVSGKGIDTAPGLQKPFNPKSKAAERAGKKK